MSQSQWVLILKWVNDLNKSAQVSTWYQNLAGRLGWFLVKRSLTRWHGTWLSLNKQTFFSYNLWTMPDLSQRPNQSLWTGLDGVVLWFPESWDGWQTWKEGRFMLAHSCGGRVPIALGPKVVRQHFTAPSMELEESGHFMAWDQYPTSPSESTSPQWPKTSH